jgi:hypothetical protein
MRRNRLFLGITNKQLYLAIICGMISSAYIWLPIAKELEMHKRQQMKESNAEPCSKIAGAHENVKDK